MPDVLYDVIVVGGGPAGLSATLMLGRCRRRVLMCDTGQPRNRHSHALHGYLTRDGIPPTDFNSLGRAELTKYGVECRTVGVTEAQRLDGRFRVSLADGRTEESRFLLLATGVTDHLPRIPGIEACYGRSVHHCPYCDGWEWQDRPLAVLGKGSSGVALALSLKTWSSDVVLCTDTSRLDRRHRERLDRNRIPVRASRVTGLEHVDGMLSTITFAAEEPLRADAMFFTSGQHPQCDLASRMGCVFNNRGTVNTGRLSDTNVPGVFVAGDASRDAQFVVVAAAEGVKAALAINQAMQKEELIP
jgi:thioredoxin reductase